MKESKIFHLGKGYVNTRPGTLPQHNLLFYYIPVIFLAQIQESHTSEIQHDEKKNLCLHTVKYGSKYGINDVMH